MGILEFILVSVIIILILILLFETREYRRTKEFTSHLQDALNAYTSGYTAITTTVQVIEKAFDQSVIEHNQIAQELTRQSTILEVHNRALMLHPRLIDKPDKENPIP